MTFCTDIHGPQRMSHTDIGDPMTFTLAPAQCSPLGFPFCRIPDLQAMLRFGRTCGKKIEEKINNHTRMLTKVFNIGESHKHLKRVQETVITHSETSAPMYYLFKDHKSEPGWRPVVSGCNSNTVGISNIVSDVV